MLKDTTDFDHLMTEHYNLDNPSDDRFDYYEQRCKNCKNLFETKIHQTQFCLKIHKSTRSCPECGKIITVGDLDLTK